LSQISSKKSKKSPFKKTRAPRQQNNTKNPFKCQTDQPSFVLRKVRDYSKATKIDCFVNLKRISNNKIASKKKNGTSFCKKIETIFEIFCIFFSECIKKHEQKMNSWYLIICFCFTFYFFPLHRVRLKNRKKKEQFRKTMWEYFILNIYSASNKSATQTRKSLQDVSNGGLGNFLLIFYFNSLSW
jgi:hypothetical protein